MKQRLVVGSAPRRQVPPRRVLKWLAAGVVFSLLLARLVLFEPIVVRGNTMAPIAADGDVLLVMSHPEPRAGDLVLVLHEGRAVLRRVLATPGQRVGSADGALTLDGIPLRTRVSGTFTYRDPNLKAPRRQQRLTETMDVTDHQQLTWSILGDHVGAARPWALELPGLEVPDGHVFVLCDNRRTCPLDERSGVLPITWIKGVATHLFWHGGARADEGAPPPGYGGFAPLSAAGIAGKTASPLK